VSSGQPSSRSASRPCASSDFRPVTTAPVTTRWEMKPFMTAAPGVQPSLGEERYPSPVCGEKGNPRSPRSPPVWGDRSLEDARVRISQRQFLFLGRPANQALTSSSRGCTHCQRSTALAGIATTGRSRYSTASTSFLRSVGLVWSFLSSSSSIASGHNCLLCEMDERDGPPSRAANFGRRTG